MTTIKNKKDFIEHFNFKVVQTNNKKPIITDWRNKARYNPNINSKSYACLAGGTPYQDGFIVVIDLDNHENKQELSGIEYWDEAKLPIDTFTVKTPNNGKHLYFKASREQLNEIESSGSGSSITQQIEMFWNDKHLVMGAFSEIDKGVYEIEKVLEVAPLPERVVSLYKETNIKEINKSIISGNYLNEWERKVLLRELKKLDLDGEFEDYDDWLVLMFALKNTGFSIEEAEKVSWDTPEAKKKIASLWSEKQYIGNEVGLGSIIHRWVPKYTDKDWLFEQIEEAVIDYVKERYSHLLKIKIGKNIGIIDLNGVNKTIVRDYKNTFPIYQSKENRIKYPFYKNGVKGISWRDVNGFDIWWREADVIEGKKTIPNTPIGIVEVNGYRYFNDWEESLVKNGDGTPDVFKQHLLETVCDGNEISYNFLLHWIYDLLANPLHRNNIAVAITGNQGTGKSIVFEILSLCFHPKYVGRIETTEDIMNSFDAGWKNSILVGVEEACFAGERKKGIWGKLKGLITSPTTSIERKGIDKETLDNKLHFLITSNSPHIVPREKNDRRYLVLKTNDNHRNDTEYFKGMYENMKSGGAYKLLQEAREHAQEALEFNFVNIPQTEIGVDNMRFSSDFVLQWLIERIENFEGESDTFFHTLHNGDIAFRTKDISVFMRDDGLITNPYSSVSMGKHITAYLGRKPRSLKVKGKSSQGFRFSSIEELKQSINEINFSGENVFIETEQEEIELIDEFSELKEKVKVG
jgi:hypothetical protein